MNNEPRNFYLEEENISINYESDDEFMTITLSKIIKIKQIFMF